ncbi:MAG: hypothetical protein NPIRA05_04900 [Nitrospirales bacterium]|nr:MAG: hypothetical protein NPIRA05_04900 [Nitrospirales bacterium]
MNIQSITRSCSQTIHVAWLTIPLLCILTIGCVPKAQIIWEESKPEPSWVTATQKDVTFFYYRGSAVKAESLELGEKAARQNAYSQVAEYLNTTLESVYEGETTDYSQDLKDTIKAKSAGLIQKAEVIDSYHKKMTRVGEGFTLERYDVHVLVRYPKVEAEKERIRQEKEIQQHVIAAYDLYQKGQESEAAGHHQKTRRFSREALDLLANVPGSKPLGTGDVSNSKELASLLRTQEQTAIRNLRKVIVWIQEPSLGKGAPRSPLATRLKAALNHHDFTVLEQRGSGASRTSISAALNGDQKVLAALVQQGAQYLIVGQASTVFSSTTLDQQIFDAQGSLKVLETQSGDTLLTIPINHRGNHRERTRAQVHALEEAGRIAGEDLVKELLAREDM